MNDVQNQQKQRSTALLFVFRARSKMTHKPHAVVA
jgi:hypothetical protein